MRILILANSDVGLYKFRSELIDCLMARGHSIALALPYGAYIEEFKKKGCIFFDTPVDRRGINPGKDYLLLLSYKRLLRAYKPDLIVTYTVKPNIYGGIAARKLHIPYVANITGLGTAFEKPGLIKTVVVNLYKFALRKCKVVFFENSSNRDDFVSLRCCSIEKTVVLNGAGVNLDTYSYQLYQEAEDVRFLFIGRIMREKGIDELLKAMKRVVGDGEACFLDVVGPCEEDYKEILAACEKEGWLKYHGYQTDVRPYIQKCNCFVLPSYHEGMANTNLECASSGRAIVTSNVPGCREAVIDGVTGFLCEPRSVDSLYCALKKVLNVDKRKFGIAGREYMERKFDKKVVVNKTIEEML